MQILINLSEIQPWGTVERQKMSFTMLLVHFSAVCGLLSVFKAFFWLFRHSPCPKNEFPFGLSMAAKNLFSHQRNFCFQRLFKTDKCSRFRWIFSYLLTVCQHTVEHCRSQSEFCFLFSIFYDRFHVILLLHRSHHSTLVVSLYHVVQLGMNTKNSQLPDWK